jgi:hypothetical protein
MADCRIDGCEKQARPDLENAAMPYMGLCAMHCKRLQRGRPLEAPAQEKLPPEKRLKVTVIHLADVDTSEDGDQEFDLAMDCVKQAARRWLKSLGWRRVRDAVQRRAETESQEADEHRAVEGKLPRGTSSRASCRGAGTTQGREDLRRDRQEARDHDAVCARPGDVGARANQDRNRRGRGQGSRARA